MIYYDEPITTRQDDEYWRIVGEAAYQGGIDRQDSADLDYGYFPQPPGTKEQQLERLRLLSGMHRDGLLKDDDQAEFEELRAVWWLE